MAAAEDTPRKKPSSATHIIVLAIVTLLALAGGAGAFAWYNSGARAEAPDVPATAEYLPLPPAFVVNLDETPVGPRYLQVEVQLVTRDPTAVEQMQHHAPALRARLLMLFAQQTYEGLASREGKEALQAEALEEARALMLAETGQAHVEALLFTSFVTQ